MLHKLSLLAATMAPLALACATTPPAAPTGGTAPATFTDQVPRLVGLKEGALPLDPPADRKFRKTRFVTVADVADFAVHNMPPKKAGSEHSEDPPGRARRGAVNLSEMMQAPLSKITRHPRPGPDPNARFTPVT